MIGLFIWSPGLSLSLGPYEAVLTVGILAAVSVVAVSLESPGRVRLTRDSEIRAARLLAPTPHRTGMESLPPGANRQTAALLRAACV